VNVDDVINGVKWIKENNGKEMLEIKVKRGRRKEIGRKKRYNIKKKEDLMNFL
jgi:hypothetical protein